MAQQLGTPQNSHRKRRLLGKGAGGGLWTDRVGKVGHSLDMQQLLKDEVQLLVCALPWAAGMGGPGSKG